MKRSLLAFLQLWLTATVLVALAFWQQSISATETARPNIIVILTDDQGWGDLSLNGNTNLSTPNIDQLAADGAMFERFYVCPVCSPTRAEFLTGRYHTRLGVYSTSAGGERLNLDEVTIADTFKSAGYATAAFGKWHNGMQYPYHPNGRGFDEFYGFCSGHWGHYYDALMEHNGQLVRGNGFCIDDFTERAMDFISDQAKKDKPFFVYLPYNTPHSPMQVPDRWWEKFRGIELKMKARQKGKPVPDNDHARAALAMCENIDWNVGRLLKKLDELKIAQDTIVAYFCDNGPNGPRWNGGMKGRKGSTDEGGVRSPMLIRWNGTIQKGTVIRQNGAAIDLLPTLADMADIPLTGTKPLDGMSLKEHLLHAQTEVSDRRIFSAWRSRASVRTQRWRVDNEHRLYDMQADPGQYKDASKKYPEVAKELVAALEAWRGEHFEGYGQDERPFLIGHPDYKYTQIPARDGISHGGIQRSNRFPNCSYFQNWTAADDYITWDAEVAETGVFDVELRYACSPAGVGGKYELTFKGSSLPFRIDQPHVVPLVGAKQDRSPRMESYVKDFRPVTIGRIKLQKGKGTLTLKATDLPNPEGIEVRLLMLTRVK
jgi:arylsulfatase A-like enzyme